MRDAGKGVDEARRHDQRAQRIDTQQRDGGIDRFDAPGEPVACRVGEAQHLRRQCRIAPEATDDRAQVRVLLVEAGKQAPRDFRHRRQRPGLVEQLSYRQHRVFSSGSSRQHAGAPDASAPTSPPVA
jgi:hypothetical protein